MGRAMYKIRQIGSYSSQYLNVNVIFPSLVLHLFSCAYSLHNLLKLCPTEVCSLLIVVLIRMMTQRETHPLPVMKLVQPVAARATAMATELLFEFPVRVLLIFRGCLVHINLNLLGQIQVDKIG